MVPKLTSGNYSLSTKLFLLAAAFILVAEIVVLVPSVSRERNDLLHARVEAAYLVSLALEGPSGVMLDEYVVRQLFSTANILGVTVNRADIRTLILTPEIDPHGPPYMHLVDLRNQNATEQILDSWATVFSNGNDLIQVTGTPRNAANNEVDIIVSQSALRADLLFYARKVLWLSLLISSLTALLLFWALNEIIVRPVERLTKSMADFEIDPNQKSHIHVPSDRNDEIGTAERNLTAMQTKLYDLLNEHRRLAALGAGISKISHDLRNILASAQLMSDRLIKSDDPSVRKLSPRLILALDRAIALSRNTLTFGRMEERVLNKAKVNLHDLIKEVFDDSAAMGIEMHNNIDAELSISSDRTHLYRSLFNLVHNSVEAIMPDGPTSCSSDKTIGSITASAEKSDNILRIQLADTGPGIPEYASAELFEPFKGSKKPGGSGLGVAISAEIIRAHGGNLSLKENSGDGALFEITLPLRATD